MRLSCACTLASIFLATVTLNAAPPHSEAIGTISLQSQTQVPGVVLQPGIYTIHLLDHLTDRSVVRIDSQQGDTHATFIGLSNEALNKKMATGTITWKAGVNGNTALRGYAFTGGPALEFVYPKDEAVTLAKENNETVPAIDPASEGRAAELSGLSKNDMEIVTLWMLSPTVASPGDSGPGIKAEKYNIASNAKQKPLMDSLPHTGSNLFLIWSLAILSLLGAGILRTRAVVSSGR